MTRINVDISVFNITKPLTGPPCAELKTVGHSVMCDLINCSCLLRDCNQGIWCPKNNTTWQACWEKPRRMTNGTNFSADQSWSDCFGSVLHKAIEVWIFHQPWRSVHQLTLCKRLPEKMAGEIFGCVCVQFTEEFVGESQKQMEG